MGARSSIGPTPCSSVHSSLLNKSKKKTEKPLGRVCSFMLEGAAEEDEHVRDVDVPRGSQSQYYTALCLLLQNRGSHEVRSSGTLAREDNIVIACACGETIAHGAREQVSCKLIEQCCRADIQHTTVVQHC